MCSAYVSLGLDVNPRTFGYFTVGTKVLLVLNCFLLITIIIVCLCLGDAESTGPVC